MTVDNSKNCLFFKTGLGEQIQKLRTENKLSQETLAKKSGLTRITIADIERGTANPTLEALASIAHAFGLNVTDLFSSGVERQNHYIMQPMNGDLYTSFVKQLASAQKGELFIQVAYAKSSGVDLLTASFKEFRELGGRIRVLVGIDQKNTTAEALYKLMLLCDELYVIHDSAFAQTYHPKVYAVSTENCTWIAVGSNNLTRGGLCTNYETCHIQRLNMENELDRRICAEVIDSFDFYKADNLAKKINSIEDIQSLLKDNLVVTEQQSRQISVKHSTPGTKNHFGHRQVLDLPSVSEKISVPASLFSTDNSATDRVNNKGIVTSHKSSADLNDSEVTATSFGSLEISSNIREIYWFEMRASTGGSRNILDLSSAAKLQSGTHPEDDNGSIPGSVAFFGLDPMARDIEKNITVVYNGIAYYPSTIKFAPNNASWRIQFKGDAETGNKSLSQFGRTDFANHILILHKITNDYYILETMAESELGTLKANSEFWATNGSSKSSKAFGKIQIR